VGSGEVANEVIVGYGILKKEEQVKLSSEELMRSPSYAPLSIVPLSLSIFPVFKLSAMEERGGRILNATVKRAPTTKRPTRFKSFFSYVRHRGSPAISPIVTKVLPFATP
jgi:hypothetical protein